MIQQRLKQEVFAKPILLKPEEMLTTQVKNTMLLAAKNGRNTKAPGLRLSAAPGLEAAGQPRGSALTPDCAPQVDSPLVKSVRPDPECPVEIQPLRRPLKLTPLELPEEVREAQRRKLQLVQQEARLTACKLDGTLAENRTRKAKQRAAKAAVSSSVSIEPLKVQQQNRSSRPQLTRSKPIKQSGDGHLEGVVCRGIPAPLCSKPAPPTLSARTKPQPDPCAVQPGAGRRRPRLTRAQRLQDDQWRSNASSGGSCPVQAKGQQEDGSRRGLPRPARKDLRDPPAPTGSGGRGGARVSQQSAEGGSGETAPRGGQPGPSNSRAKRTVVSVSPHKTAPPPEILQP
ncbi:uncharacterized protein ACNS7B_013256 [Menidia menidia]